MNTGSSSSILHGTLVITNNTTHTVPREDPGHRFSLPAGAGGLPLNRGSRFSFDKA